MLDGKIKKDFYLNIKYPKTSSFTGAIAPVKDKTWQIHHTTREILTALWAAIKICGSSFTKETKPRNNKKKGERKKKKRRTEKRK